MSSARSALLLMALTAACASPPRPAPLQQPDLAQEEAPGNPWGERMLVEAMAIPAAWLTRDVDRATTGDKTSDAWGYGLRGAIGNADQSAGLLYQGFHTDDDTLDAQTVGLDFDVRTPLEDEIPVFLRAGAGVGLAWLDAPGDESVGTEMSLQGRIGFDFQPSDRFVLGTSLGGILFGHPGETEAYGAFVTIGVTLVF